MIDSQRQLILLILLAAPCVLILVGGVGGFWLYAFLVRRLRLGHNALWASIGSPSVIPAGPGDYSYRAMFNWVLRRGYRDISDPSFLRLAGACRILLLSIFVGLGFIALLVVASLVIW